jgi:hypothetical protein
MHLVKLINDIILFLVLILFITPKIIIFLRLILLIILKKIY